MEQSELKTYKIELSDEQRKLADQIVKLGVHAGLHVWIDGASVLYRCEQSVSSVFMVTLKDANISVHSKKLVQQSKG